MSDTIAKGDIVEIVMDAVHVSDDRGEFERILVHGVFPKGAAHPPRPEGARRNVVQVFFGVPHGGIPAFLVAVSAADRENEASGDA